MGACIYELAHGTIPYKSHSLTKAIIKIVIGDAPQASEDLDP